MKPAKQLIDELTADGISQSKIGAETGIPQATISRIQSGVIADTKASYWIRIDAFHTAHFAAKDEAESGVVA